MLMFLINCRFIIIVVLLLFNDIRHVQSCLTPLSALFNV